MHTLSKDLLAYMEQLSLNNDRDWFHDPDNQDRYQKKRKEFVSFVEALRDGIADVCEPELSLLQSKHMIFRINRDVRFSKDKSPYKNNFWAYLAKHWWKKSPYAWRYLHIQPGNNSFFWGWVHYPPKETIEVIRDKMERDWKHLDQLVTNKEFVKQYGAVLWRELKTYPRNRSADAPNLHWVRKKEWYAIREFKDSDLLKKDFLNECIEAAKALSPINDFLNDWIEDLFV